MFKGGLFVQVKMRRSTIGSVLLTFGVGLTVGVASEPHPAAFALWAITVPWFIERKQGFSSGGRAYAVAFALPACVSTLYKAALAPEVGIFRFILVAALLSPAAITLGFAALHVSKIDDEANLSSVASLDRELSDDSEPAKTNPAEERVNWMAIVPSSTVLLDPITEYRSEGLSFE